MLVSEYADDIFQHMIEVERKLTPNPGYMEHQPELRQWHVRAVLVDWLVQVHQRFRLLPETLYLAVNLVDRFLSKKAITLPKLQLVGASALFIAAKYEEVIAPSVREMLYMVDGAYTADELLKAERFMVHLLGFDLGWPGPMNFLRRVSKADDYDIPTRTLAKYLLETALLDERFIGITPSKQAAAACRVARTMLHKGDWTAQHAELSGYSAEQLNRTCQLFVDVLRAPPRRTKAVFNKYADKCFLHVSTFAAQWISTRYAKAVPA
ncbi:cyclin-like protein [Thamnocephalis sphaerospora]|uniref:Cyclin-like protein n=1 Tax=Thamnocephalis sphaerospora TaxID=78915 RepID=A0A4P9XSW4_9FUNG|nr:cyclin-like protein [Thamnocephalis sphaerospora]|eukprot:RKP09227.1 cyclin-like protein [Thamnocephalis sphaerospora]